MAKLYSSLFIPLIFFTSLLNAQNVGVGTSTPREKLEVAGAILIGTTSGVVEGTIRYNPTLHKFEGRDNSGWKPFAIGSGETLWKKNGTTMYPDTPQYNGNVGIGTTIPLTKLHVKGNGNIAIRAETASATLPALDVINTSGVALKAKITHDSLWAIEAINQDSSGYAIKLINAQAQDTVNGDIVVIEGGNAALLVGDLDMLGAIRNSDDNLYGGSVAINDGITVGDIAGASCTPATATSRSFTVDFGASFEVIWYGLNNNSPYDNIVADNTTSDCRAVTNFYVEPYVGDDQAFQLNFEIYVRGSSTNPNYIATVLEESANINLNPPLPANYPAGPLVYFAYNSSLCGCYTSKWGFDTNIFNGEDPNNVANDNWFFRFNSKTSDGEYLFGYKGRVDYNWGDTISAPAYAAYGDIRASGSVYANSDQLLGDVAEYFKVFSAGRQPEVGDIVSISKKDPQTFELASIAYDPLLVGVVSEKPSVHLNDPSSGYPIGLTGRVKVKVNLMGGEILVGDAITSSSVEGVGMKANDNGTVIGYALEAFDGSRTDEGKIIILLARGHIEKINPAVKVEEVQSPTYGGMLVKGAIKVMNDEKVVFEPWDSKLAGKIPSDVEFDDLFVQLTPFGGDAKMIVKEVNAEGITVEIIQKSEGFEGFYYQTDIVTSKMESLSDKDAVVAKDMGNYEERVTRATKLYKDWNDAFEELQKKGGMSLAPIQSMTSGKQVSLYKKEVAKSWERNAPELLAQWQSLGRELSQVINDDQSIVRKIREAN